MSGKRDEPTTREFLEGIADMVASNRLTNIILRKVYAQSFYEFFNRIVGTGMLLFGVGTIGILGAVVLDNHRFSIFDLGNTVLIAGPAILFWIFLVVVSAINSGDSPLYQSDRTSWPVELTKVVGGLIGVCALVYQFVIKQGSAAEFIMLSLLAAVLIGMWLISLAWLFGGISGLWRLHGSAETE